MAAGVNSSADLYTAPPVMTAPPSAGAPMSASPPDERRIVPPAIKTELPEEPNPPPMPAACSPPWADTMPPEILTMPPGSSLPLPMPAPNFPPCALSEPSPPVISNAPPLRTPRPGAFSPHETRLFVPDRLIETEFVPQSKGGNPVTVFVSESPSSTTVQFVSARMATLSPAPPIVNGPAPVSETIFVLRSSSQPSPER